jgi:FMN phosphatase YigB (HAD superfamily)
MSKRLYTHSIFLLIIALLIGGLYVTFLKRTPTTPQSLPEQTTLFDDTSSEDAEQSEAVNQADAAQEDNAAQEESASEPDSAAQSEEIVAKEAVEDDVAEADIVDDSRMHVFFDLNNVLFEISKKLAFSQLGAMDITSYTLGGNKTEDLESKLFEILGYLEPAPAQSAKDELPLYNGAPFPPIMCRWLKGEISGAQLLNKGVAFIENPSNDHYFRNKREKRLVQKILQIMVDAPTRSKLYIPMKKGIALAEQSKKAGHKTYLFLNIDHQVITLLKEKHPEIFGLFDEIIMSSKINMLKPGKKSFDHIVKTYKLKPKQCYFIDNNEKLIACARANGMNGVHYEEDNHAKIVKALEEHGVLT